MIQEKSKPLFLNRERRNEGYVFFPAAENLSEDFLCPKIPERNFLVSKTSNKPCPLGHDKIQEVFDKTKL